MAKIIKEYSYGLIEAETVSRKWGDNFRLFLTSKDQLSYAENCLKYLDEMPEATAERLKKYLFRYFKDYEDCLDEPLMIDEENIMDSIRIKAVLVDENCRQDIIEFHIEGECEWEIDHGLEITFSDDRILYVGPVEDYGPNSTRLEYAINNWGYYDPDAGLIMNYADKE